MSRITQYPEAETINRDDFLVIDGGMDGTRKVRASSFGLKLEDVFRLFPTWFDGGSISKTDGDFSSTTNTDWKYTWFYRVPAKARTIGLSLYAGGNSAGFAFYDSDAVFISGNNVTSKVNSDIRTYTVPENAKYVRFTNNTNTNYHPTIPTIYFVSDKDAEQPESRYVSWRTGLNINGSYSSSSSRMCTIEPIEATEPIRISLAADWRVWVSYYKDGVWVKDGKQSQYNGFVTEPGYDVYLSVGKRDNSAITNKELATASDAIAVTLLNKYEYRRKMLQALPNWSSLSMFYKIGILGDSFASGSLHHPDGSGSETNYNLSWGQILARDIGATVTNYSKGGLSASTWLTNTEFGLSKLLSSDPEQLYICAFGINDWNQRTTYPIGTIADCNVDYSQNPATFYGSYGKVIGNIKAHASNAKIIMLSIMRENERILDADAKAIADHFDIPFIQLTDDDFFVSDYYARSMYENHPLSYGYSGIAQAMKRLLSKCIENNAEYFGTYYGAL
jgi:hypothetical protein